MNYKRHRNYSIAYVRRSIVFPTIVFDFGLNAYGIPYVRVVYRSMSYVRWLRKWLRICSNCLTIDGAILFNDWMVNIFLLFIKITTVNNRVNIIYFHLFKLTIISATEFDQNSADDQSIDDLFIEDMTCVLTRQHIILLKTILCSSVDSSTESTTEDATKSSNDNTTYQLGALGQRICQNEVYILCLFLIHASF